MGVQVMNSPKNPGSYCESENADLRPLEARHAKAMMAVEKILGAERAANFVSRLALEGFEIREIED